MPEQVEDANTAFLWVWNMTINQDDPRQLDYWATAIELLATACDPRHEPEVRAAARRKAETPLRWLKVVQRNMSHA